MVLNYQTIFQANNIFELLNHVSSKQSIFYKTGLTKILSFKQAYRSEVFRTCTVVLGRHFMHFRFAWSVNLVHASWHLKETMACIKVYRVSALAILWWRRPRLPCLLGYSKQERPLVVDLDL